MSFHESGKTLFPWGGFEDELGEGEGVGYNANVSLPAGTYDAAFLQAFRELAPPLIEDYRPDVLVLELGMDTLFGDPLTHLRLTNNAHVEVIEQLRQTNLPTLVLGGGGYHAENTIRSWALAWQAFAGDLEMDTEFAGLGGVMLGNTDWLGVLRDRQMPVTAVQQREVEPAIAASIKQLKETLFPLHDL
jgi:acetoin utilization protein AcuC